MNLSALLARLDDLYDKKERIQKSLSQTCEDIELLENIIMHASNKKARYGV